MEFKLLSYTSFEVMFYSSYFPCSNGFVSEEGILDVIRVWQLQTCQPTR